MATTNVTSDLTSFIRNSMKSDILPALEAGAWATFIPQDLAWDLEHADPPETSERYAQITALDALPNLIASMP